MHWNGQFEPGMANFDSTAANTLSGVMFRMVWQASVQMSSWVDLW